MVNDYQKLDPRFVGVESSIAAAIHDMNNVNHAIMSSAELAMMLYSPDDRLQEMLENIRNYSIRLGTMSRDIAQLFEGVAQTKNVCRINELIRDAVEFFAKAFKGILCVFSFDATRQNICANKLQIDRVVGNLVINAVQSMMGQGIIHIGTRELKIGCERAVEMGIAEGDYVEVSICDHGCGIPDENMQRIFDVCFTTKDTGTGVGLASVLSIVKAHSGAIRVESEVNKGTTFFVYLPLCN